MFTTEDNNDPVGSDFELSPTGAKGTATHGRSPMQCATNSSIGNERSEYLWKAQEDTPHSKLLFELHQ